MSGLEGEGCRQSVQAELRGWQRLSFLVPTRSCSRPNSLHCFQLVKAVVGHGAVGQGDRAIGGHRGLANVHPRRVVFAATGPDRKRGQIEQRPDPGGIKEISRWRDGETVVATGCDRKLFSPRMGLTERKPTSPAPLLGRISFCYQIPGAVLRLDPG